MSYDPYFESTTTPQALASAQDVTFSRIGFVAFCALVIIIVIVATAVLLILYAKYAKIKFFELLKKIVRFFDFFSLRHMVRFGQSPVRTKTVLGGIFTIFFFVAVFTIIALLLIDIIRNNIIDRRSIIPEKALASDMPLSFDGDFYLSIWVHNFNDPSCTTALVPSISGFTPQKNVIVNATFDTTNQTCAINVTCVQCKLSGSSQVVGLQWNSQFAMASAIEFVAKVPHFFNKQQLVVYDILTPSSGLVFRGSDPSEFYVSLTRSYYTVCISLIF